MTLRETFRSALLGLSANLLRSLLTVLGILIGVAAVITLVAVGNGSSAQVQARIRSLGTNTLTVFNSGRLANGGASGRFRALAGGGGGFGGGGFGGGGFGGGGGGAGATRLASGASGTSSSGTQIRAVTLGASDVAALQDPANAPDVTAVAPVVNADSVSITYGAATATPTTFVGTTPSYLSTNDRAIAEGQSFSDHDVTARRRVILLGTTVVQNLFGTVDPIGRSVLVNGVSFNVDGVLQSKGSNGTQDQDDIVIAPYTSVQDHVSGGTAGTFNQLVVEAKSSKAIDAAQSEVLSTLDAQHHITGATSPFSVLNQASLLATSTATNRTFTVLLGAVAAISLLVGGIGVMNIMLVTVTERTREIGIRKALGARRSDILGQFLTEAVLLSLLGGMAGVALGIALSHFRIDGVRPVVTWFPVVLAFGVSVLVGLFFGIYPANRAAGLRPIEALRRE